jgi:hypothetical protein
MKGYEEVEIQLHGFFNSALDVREWPASLPGRCTPGERSSGTSGVPRIFFGGGGGGSTNLVEDRGQRERGSGGGSPLLRGS